MPSVIGGAIVDGQALSASVDYILNSPVSGPLPPSIIPWASTAKVIFDDEFDGDLSKWYILNNFKGWDDSAEETYMTAQAKVSGGTCKLTAIKGGATGYQSGALTTRGSYGGGRDKLAFTYGYAETRMRCPKGGGFWPAFWLVGAAGTPGWPAYGEFDVMEQYGTYPGYYEATTHWAQSGNHQQGGQEIDYPAGTSALDWHTYGVLWEAAKLSYLLDGKVVQTFVPQDAGAKAALGYGHTLILNLAVGGSGPRTWHKWDGSWQPNELPGVLEIDYVRVFQP